MIIVDNTQLGYLILLVILILYFFINNAIALGSIMEIYKAINENSACASCMESNCGGLKLDNVKLARNAGLFSMVFAIFLGVMLVITVKGGYFLNFSPKTLSYFTAGLFFLFLITSGIMLGQMNSFFNKIKEEACGFNCVNKTCGVDVCAFTHVRNSLIASIIACCIALTVYLVVFFRKVYKKYQKGAPERERRRLEKQIALSQREKELKKLKAESEKIAQDKQASKEAKRAAKAATEAAEKAAEAAKIELLKEKLRAEKEEQEAEKAEASKKAAEEAKKEAEAAKKEAEEAARKTAEKRQKMNEAIQKLNKTMGKNKPVAKNAQKTADQEFTDLSNIELVFDEKPAKQAKPAIDLGGIVLEEKPAKSADSLEKAKKDLEKIQKQIEKATQEKSNIQDVFENFSEKDMQSNPSGYSTVESEFEKATKKLENLQKQEKEMKNVINKNKLTELRITPKPPLPPIPQKQKFDMRQFYRMIF